MSTEQKRMVTITNGSDTVEVSALQWQNMQAGSTYGFKEVTSTPPELAQFAKSNTTPSVADQIAALEEQKKAPGLSPQEKANITKQINALKNA
jgi:hypothetical protein